MQTLGSIRPMGVFISSTMLLVLFAVLWFTSIGSSNGVVPLSIGLGLFLSLSCVALTAHVNEWNLADKKTLLRTVGLLAFSTISLSVAFSVIAT